MKQYRLGLIISSSLCGALLVKYSAVNESIALQSIFQFLIFAGIAALFALVFKHFKDDAKKWKITDKVLSFNSNDIMEITWQEMYILLVDSVKNDSENNKATNIFLTIIFMSSAIVFYVSKLVEPEWISIHVFIALSGIVYFLYIAYKENSKFNDLTSDIVNAYFLANMDITEDKIDKNTILKIEKKKLVSFVNNISKK